MLALFIHPFPPLPSKNEANTPPPLRIQEVLLHSLHANKANWPTLLQAHALNLLRSGETVSFPDLLTRVLDDVRNDTATRAAAADSHAKTNGAKANGLADAKSSLAIPPHVVEEMLKAVRESLESVVEIDESES